MTDGGLTNPSTQSTLMKKTASWLLIIPSILIGIFLFELLSQLFLPWVRNADPEMRRLIYFFDGPGTIFRDYGETFTYVPHSDIRAVTLSYSDVDFNVEYDYHIQTNNFGFVQDTDVRPEQTSLLLLGDSFTEGVGAEPWFRLVSSEIAKLGYQPINGGIGGTGFSSWLKLDRYLVAADIRIGKLVILFISDDYRRPARNIVPDELRCFSDLSLCRVEEKKGGVFFRYRLPPPEELPSWVAKIRTSREATLKARVKALLPATHLVYMYLTELVRPSPQMARDERGEQESRAAIAELIKTYGPENVAFIHLPQKEEIDSGPDVFGLKARRSIQEAGGRLFDGFKLCRLVAADYHPNDLHPNSRGYSKIAACTMSVIKEMAR
jgi:lysophospholipase L1-like esterase